MKKILSFLLIFCIIVSTFTSTVYADIYDVLPFSDIPKPGNEKK